MKMKMSHIYRSTLFVVVPLKFALASLASTDIRCNGNKQLCTLKPPHIPKPGLDKPLGLGKRFR